MLRIWILIPVLGGRSRNKFAKRLCVFLNVSWLLRFSNSQLWVILVSKTESAFPCKILAKFYPRRENLLKYPGIFVFKISFFAEMSNIRRGLSALPGVQIRKDLNLCCNKVKSERYCYTRYWKSHFKRFFISKEKEGSGSVTLLIKLSGLWSFCIIRISVHLLKIPAFLHFTFLIKLSFFVSMGKDLHNFTKYVVESDVS